MSNTLTQQTTKVVGYYNGKPWPVHLIISEFNITLQLERGAFIIDRQGRKINDPFFEKYAGQLAKEVGEKDVPILRIPVVKPVVAIRDGHSVHEIKEFTVDKHGGKVPVMPKPRVQAEVQINVNPVHGMTIEQARKLKLVRPTRTVPEDYGAPESDGSPSHGGTIPEIKYATDSVRGNKPAPLPKELTQVTEKEAEKLTPEQIQLANNLQQTAAKVAPLSGADDVGFGNPIVEAAQTIRQVQEEQVITPAAEQPAQAPAPPPTPVVEIAGGQPAAEALPEPTLDDVPPPPVETATVPLVTPKSTGRFVCPTCQEGFPFESGLVKHIKNTHPAEKA